MPTKARRTTAAEAEAILRKSIDFTVAEVVTKAANPTAPISLRLSAPLLERIDKLAAHEGRSRSNLIQRILWEYFRRNNDGGKTQDA
jgi:predicted DNA binding CopG/RHH family protein